MQIKQLKEYLNQLPVELDEFEVVYSEFKKLTEDHTARLDMPVHSIVIDNKHKEMVMGTSETIDEVLHIGESTNTEVPIGNQRPEDLEPIPDGTYPCLWSGWNVEVRLQDKIYNLSTEPVNKGVKGRNIESTVVIKNGIVTDIRALS